MNPKFRLVSPFDKDKVLTVSVYGKISYDVPGTDDDVWMLVQAPIDLMSEQDDSTAGFYIVSFKYKFALVYTPKTSGEEILAVPFVNDDSATRTIWKISPDSEIYTYTEVPVEESPGGGNMVISKKFLWSILDGVYVTADEHLAEKWTAVTLDGYVNDDENIERFDGDTSERYLWARRLFYLLILACILFILLRATSSKRK